MSRSPNTIEGILARVIRDASGCWLWGGTVNGAGYATVAYQGKRQLVHRLAYGRRYGPIPDGLQLDHLCRVRRCVRPDHLEAVRPGVNSARGARGFELTGYCRAGLHPVTEPGSVQYDVHGGRRCAECRRATKRRAYWAARGFMHAPAEPPPAPWTL